MSTHEVLIENLLWWTLAIQLQVKQTDRLCPGGVYHLAGGTHKNK